MDWPPWSCTPASLQSNLGTHQSLRLGDGLEFCEKCSVQLGGPSVSSDMPTPQSSPHIFYFTLSTHCLWESPFLPHCPKKDDLAPTGPRDVLLSHAQHVATRMRIDRSVGSESCSSQSSTAWISRNSCIAPLRPPRPDRSTQSGEKKPGTVVGHPGSFGTQ